MEESEAFKWALKIVIKRQMRELIEQLRENGEEIAIVSADVKGGSCSHFGSPDGEWFMFEQRNITTDFLNFCKSRGKRNGLPSRRSSCASVSKTLDFVEIPEVSVPSPGIKSENTIKVVASKDDIGDTVQTSVVETSVDTGLSSVPDNHIDVVLDMDCSDAEDAENFEESVDDPDYEPPKQVHRTKDTIVRSSYSTETSEVNVVVRKAKKVRIGRKEKKAKLNKPGGRNSRIVTCPHCGISLVGENNLKPHIDRMHLKIRKNKCEICSKNFFTPFSLESHVMTIHTRKCESCLEYVVESEAWAEGITHSNPREVTCQCGATVIIAKKTKAKNTSMEFIERDDIDINSFGRGKAKSTKKHACVVCDRLFVSKGECEKHVLTHSSVKNFICYVCGYRYKDKKSLGKHMFIDHGIYQKKCEICMRNFSHATSLKVHMGKVHPKSLNNNIGSS